MGSKRRQEHAEDGFMLLFMVVLVALLLIGLAIAAPVVAYDLRRDKELESEHRQMQYVRAIRLFHSKTNSYPPNMKALEKTNNIRFLRKQYVDPLTGESNWRLIHLGEQQTKTHVYFGEELTGLPTGGLGAAAGLASSGTLGAGAVGPTTVSSTNALNAGFGGAGINGSSGTSGATGSTGTSAFGDGSLGQIVGVGTAKSGESILQPNQQTSYETWEFWYDPRIELLYKSANPTGGGGLGSQSASSFGKDAVSGQPNSGSSGSTGTTGSSTFGSGSSGFGSATRP